MQAGRRNFRLSTKLLVAILSIPTLVIIATGAALIVVLLGNAAVRLNQAQADAETRLAKTVIASLTMDISKDVADCSNWDEMYDQTAKPLDPQWTKENLGPYGVEVFGLSRMFIFGGDGAIKYQFASDSGAETHLNRKELRSLQTYALAAMSSWRPGVIKAIGGVAEIEGQPLLVAISPIAVNSDKRKAAGVRPRNVLIFVHALDRPLLGKLASDFGLHDLHVTREASGLVDLANPLGRPTRFSFAWTRSDAGSRFFDDTRSTIVIVGTCTALMFVLLGFVWAFIIGRMQKAEARAVAAEEISKSKSLFIANMSHELRTPLNAIIGFSEFIFGEMLGGVSIPKYKEYAGDILASGQHLLGIVNNLLLFSKLESRAHRTEVNPLNLATEVAEVIRIMQGEAASKEIGLHVMAKSPALMVEADQMSLRQILFNLIGNALKFSERKKDVRIEITENGAGDTCELKVIDEGCGIPERTLAEIGNPFVQAENAYSRQYQGTGLGLAICIGLAGKMGASIKIDSKEYVGTTVSVFLPACRQRPAADLEPSQADDVASADRKRASNTG